ncbi:MAG TPA: hypothetical protein VFZ65_07985 [Planctomycetota bacterium]|nr:hypothetical protein [Planctomycetota bacterium]
MRATLLAFVALVGLVAAQPPAPAPATTVATHYFYWYRWPGEHFAEPGAPGREGHCRHFADPEHVSYLSVDWHAANFAAMAEAGIDVALPVYWGAPGAYDRPDLAFSRRGLPPMVAALERLQQEGTPPPKLGLFYDTTTLANDARGAAPSAGRPDLTTAAGQDLFCTTVTDYFAAVPEQHWARHRGGVLVVLYTSAFASRWNAELGGVLRRRFAQRFAGEKVCLVADASWGEIGQDLTTSWGAALWAPRLFPGVAQIGAGYDDRAVPGRRTPVREREQGAFYGFSWQRAIAAHPELVLLETWNEMHEGTELCPTRELGRQYLDLTKAWIARLRRGAGPGPAIVLRHAEPRAQPDLSWGAEAAGRDVVSADFATGERLGLREIGWQDGPCRVADGALRPGTAADGTGSYLYFQVSDHLMFDGDARFELIVEHANGTRLEVEYDSHDARAALGGAYTRVRTAGALASGPWMRDTFVLPRARFANRENGGADLRLVLVAHTAAIRRLELRRK